MHEEAQRERHSHGSVSKLLLAAHGGGGGGGGVVGGDVGGLCRWETHEGFRGTPRRFQREVRPGPGLVPGPGVRVRVHLFQLCGDRVT